MAKPKNKVTCKCGSEWNTQEVLNDKTVHIVDSYRFRFLGIYGTSFSELIGLNACPNCREETKKL